MQLHTNFISNIARSRQATDNIEQVKVLIEHNIGQAPIEDQAETSVLFGLIAERYERRNLLISTNQPFFVWNSIFLDLTITIATIDHLVHHSTNCSGQVNSDTVIGLFAAIFQRRHVRTIELIAYHVTLILPYIGTKPLAAVHSGSLQAFCDSRIDDDKVSPTTVNRTVEVVRSILTKAARVWRDDDGNPWLATAPLIEMLDTSATKRQPYPITWEE